MVVSTPGGQFGGSAGPVSKPPIPTSCGQCGAPIWSAVIGGWNTLLDPDPLTLAGELLARLQGRTVVQTIPGTNLRELQPRTLDHIRSDLQPAAILATHICTPPPHPPLVSLWPDPAPSDSEEMPF